MLILSALMPGVVCRGQPHPNGPGINKPSGRFADLTDTLVKKEIALFNFKGASVTTIHSSGQSALTEIPFRSCDGKTVNLFKGSTFIHLYFTQTNGQPGQRTINRLDSIFLVTHDHYWVKFPKSAFVGLIDPISCDHRDTKKEGPYNSPFYKAFQSADKRRIYIYMIGGIDRERYEVTWVIKDSEFYTRTIDPI